MDYIEFFLRTLQIPDIREALEGGDGEGEGRVRGRERHRPSAPLFSARPPPFCQRLMPLLVVREGWFELKGLGIRKFVVEVWPRAILRAVQNPH